MPTSTTAAAGPGPAAPATRFIFDTKPHGAGGFARVIRGRDNTLERDIAVKVLNPLATEFTEAEQERFRREARILADLTHPNIPAIYDVDFSPGRFLIVFQFIPGINLRTVLEEEGPCQLASVRNWFTQLASALEHAHAKGIVHRDIKPENIIITTNRETAYLVDFGIALSAEEAKKLTESGYAMGTPGYMSPEQQAGEMVDWRSDLYSLGVTLYEALAGQRPPVGGYEELSVGNEAIPPQIDELIKSCLLVKARRIESVKLFSTALAGALRPTKPLSDVLAHGRLHELANALETLTADDFEKLPEGQRTLILEKMSDVVSSGAGQLELPAVEFLRLMLATGILLDKDSYRQVVTPAVQWGFVRYVQGRIGSRELRLALERAAHEAKGGPYEVLKEEFSAFLKNTVLKDRDDWYLHEVRKMIQSLLANPSCNTGSADLGAALKQVNLVQRSRGNGVRATAAPPQPPRA